MNTLLLIGGFIGLVAIVIVILVVSGVFSSNDKPTTSSSSGCSNVISLADAKKLVVAKKETAATPWSSYNASPCLSECKGQDYAGGKYEGTSFAWCWNKKDGGHFTEWAYCDKSCKKDGDGLKYLNEKN